MGQYALRLLYDDGHDSGVYSWDYFEKLDHERDVLWQKYLEELEKVGASRDPHDPEMLLCDKNRPSARLRTCLIPQSFEDKMTDKSKKNVSEAEKQIDFGFTKVEEAKKEEKVREVFDGPKYDLMNDILSCMHRKTTFCSLKLKKPKRREGS